MLLTNLIKVFKCCKKQPSLALLIKEHLNAIKSGLEAVAAEEKDIFSKELLIVEEELEILNANDY